MTSKGLARPNNNPSGTLDIVRWNVETAIARGWDTGQIMRRYGYTLVQIKKVEDRMERIAWEVSAK